LKKAATLTLLVPTITTHVVPFVLLQPDHDSKTPVAVGDATSVTVVP
jgi:hypothetical protein